MSQFSNSPNDTFSSAPAGDDATSAYAPTGWPFPFGGPTRVNAWGAPIFPQASLSWPTSLPSSTFPFAPPAPQSASVASSWLSDWIANRSLLGAIPRELDKPVGSDGLFGLLGQPTPRGGFFPSDEAGIRLFLADRSSGDWAAPPQPAWPYPGHAALTQSGATPLLNPPTDPGSDSAPQPPADPGVDSISQPPAANWYGFDARAGVNAWGAPDFTQAPASTPRGPSPPSLDSSIAERSPLGLIPAQQNQTTGTNSLLGQLPRLIANPLLPLAPWSLLSGQSSSSIGTAIEAARRGLVESASDVGDSAGIVWRGLQGKQAFQDNESNQSENGGDEVGQLLQQPISEGWSNPDWWVANLTFAAAKSSPTTGLGLVGMAIGSEITPGWGTAIGAAAGYGLGALFQSLGPT
jgi:hypothetical protein